MRGSAPRLCQAVLRDDRPGGWRGPAAMVCSCPFVVNYDPARTLGVTSQDSQGVDRCKVLLAGDDLNSQQASPARPAPISLLAASPV